jgi:TRAP-type C4-dicarboxylate transport system permease small subunit
MQRIERVIAAASSWFNYVACAAIIVMMLLSCADVVLRILGTPIPGTYEMVGLLGAVIIAFAMAYTSLQRGHVAVEMLYEKLPPRAQRLVDSAGNLTGAALFGLIAWQSTVYAADLRQSGEVSLTLQMPLYPIVYGIAFGCGMLALVLLVDFIKSFQRGLAS